MSNPRAPISTSFSLKQAFFEAFFVLLGVGFALVANAWWEGRQRAERTSVAVASLESELEANLEAIRASAAYHTEKLTLLSGWQGEKPPTPRDFPQGFIHAAQVLRAAWETARTADALASLDYELQIALANAYANQQRYELQSRMAGQLIYETILERSMDGLLAGHRNLAAIISTFAYRERELAAHYESTLGALRATLGALRAAPVP